MRQNGPYRIQPLSCLPGKCDCGDHRLNLAFPAPPPRRLPLPRYYLPILRPPISPGGSCNCAFPQVLFAYTWPMPNPCTGCRFVGGKGGLPTRGTISDAGASRIQMNCGVSRREIMPEALLGAVILCAGGEALQRNAGTLDAIAFLRVFTGSGGHGCPLSKVTPIITHADRRSVLAAPSRFAEATGGMVAGTTGNLPYPGGIGSSSLAWPHQTRPALFRKPYRVGGPGLHVDRLAPVWRYQLDHRSLAGGFPRTAGYPAPAGRCGRNVGCGSLRAGGHRDRVASPIPVCR